MHACGKAVQVGVYEFLAAWVLLHSRLANAGPVHSAMLLQERLLAGGVAGAVSRTVVAPLERLRSIMMAVRAGFLHLFSYCYCCWLQQLR